MAVLAYVDSVALQTGTGTQTVEPGSLTFTPTGLINAGNLLTADGGQADANQHFGVSASDTDEAYQAFESEDGSPSSDVGAVANVDASMGGLLDNNAVDYLGQFLSFNASPAGFSFNLSNAPAVASILNYVLLGGDVTIDPFLWNLGASASGNKTKTGLNGGGASPSAVIFFSCASLLADTLVAGTASGTVMVGWMCPDGTQGCCLTRHTDGQGTTDTSRRQRTDKCLMMHTTSAEQAEAEFVSMGANEFTCNFPNAHTANLRVYGVAIFGGVWTAGSFLSTTTTGGGNDVATTGVNPKVSLFQTYGLGANTTTQTGAKRGIGACDGTRRWAVAYDDLDNENVSIADSYLDRTRALVSITAGTPTLDDAYDITHGAEKFTYDHEVASGVAIQVIYLVGGDAPSAVVAPPKPTAVLQAVHRAASY